MTPNDPNTQLWRERKVVIALTLVGAALRFWGFGQLGMTHFDEGIYAFAGLWSLSPKGLAALDPGVIPYSPPGYPILVGLAYSVLGVSDYSALLVSLICGVATIPVSAWISRRTFGPGAGAAAAAFAALSMAHLAFSRKALTDAPFLLSWLIALGLGMRFLERPRLGRAIVFGIAVGLAQNVKYNGGLSGIVIVLAALFGLVGNRDDRTLLALSRTFGYGLLAALIAGLIYWPWFAFVEANGGYHALIRHQRSYSHGVESWLPHLGQQLAQVVSLSGGKLWGFALWTLAWLGAGYAALGWKPLFVCIQSETARTRIGLIATLAILAALPEEGWWAGIVWFPSLIFDKRPSHRILAAWWVVLTVMTPFYHPYARLWLPIQALGWILLAGAVVRIGVSRTIVFSSPLGLVVHRPIVLLTSTLVGLCVLLETTHLLHVDHFGVPEALPVTEFFLPTDQLRVVASNLSHDNVIVNVRGARTVRVYARRPLVFYLATRGIPVALVEGRHGIGLGFEHSDEFAILDAAIDESSPPHIGAFQTWHFRQAWADALDPVTRLDVNPYVAYHSRTVTPFPIRLYSPRQLGFLPSTGPVPDPPHAK